MHFALEAKNLINIPEARKAKQEELYSLLHDCLKTFTSCPHTYSPSIQILKVISILMYPVRYLPCAAEHFPEEEVTDRST